ncbi:MAG: hypothetical protein EHM43_06405, partial [Ignavibacteriae bacterium]
MLLIRLLIVVLAIVLLAGNVTAAPDSVATPDSPSVSRQELLARDSAYQRFVLDSMELDHQAHIEAMEAQNGTGLHQPKPEAIIGVMIPIVSIIVVFLFLWRSNEAKKAVRLAMIERGMDPGLLQEQPNESSRKYGALRIGMLLAGVGLGLLVGYLISTQAMLPDDDFVPLVIIASALLFGGAGLILYHLMATKIEQSK